MEAENNIFAVNVEYRSGYTTYASYIGYASPETLSVWEWREEKFPKWYMRLEATLLAKMIAQDSLVDRVVLHGRRAGRTGLWEFEVEEVSE